jgi:hypothetical protein
VRVARLPGQALLLAVLAGRFLARPGLAELRRELRRAASVVRRASFLVLVALRLELARRTAVRRAQSRSPVVWAVPRHPITLAR